MKSRIKALSFQTIIYGTGHILARLVTFLLLPLYTNVFDPERYAVVTLAYTFMGFMAVVLHYGLDASLMKHYVPADKPERTRQLSTAYASFLISSMAFLILMLVFRRGLAEPLLGVYIPKYIAMVGVILMLDILWSVPVLILRTEEKPFTFITFSLINVCATLGLNIIFVLKMHLGVDGVLVSNIWASLLMFLLTLPIIVRRTDTRAVSWITWKKLMRFGIPFLPSGIFAMIMEMAGRYMLKFMTDMETVGLYGASYKLGMLMMLAVMGFNMAWQPFFLREGGGKDKKVMYARVASYVLAILGLVWVLLLIWVGRLVRFPVGGTTFYGSEFWSCTPIVSWIALGYFFHAAYLLQLPGPFLSEKSHWVATTRGVGAVVTIVLNLVLIPLWGAMGAAVAMMLSFLSMAGYMYYINRRIFPMDFEWSRLLRIVALMAVTFIAHRFFHGNWLRDGLITLIYPIGLVLSGFLRGEEWRTVAQLFRGRNGELE